MAIELLKSSDPQPWAEVRFKINYPKHGGKETRITSFLFPYKDEDCINVMEVFLSTANTTPKSLKSCYIQIMKHAVLYNLRAMIIPLFPDRDHSTLSRKQVLYAACLAYSETFTKNSITVYLFDEDFSPEEEDILRVTKYIENTFVDSDWQFDRYSVCYSADYEPSDAQYSIDPDIGPSNYFDPSRGIFQLDAGFGETVLQLIRAKGMTESQCYNKANISRAAFHKIRQSAKDPESTYRPTKQTAMALAVALELSLEDAEDLLERAGYAFSHSNKGDIIVEYFLIHENYNLFELNEVLFQFDQPLLGSI